MKDGWQTTTLEDACEFSNGLWKGEKPPFVRVGVIRNTNFTKEGMLDDSDIAFLDVEQKKFDKRRLKFGDVILEKSGGGPKQAVGRVALFDKTEGDFSFSNFTAALRVRDPSKLDFRFLHKFLHWTYLSGVTEGMQSHSTGIRNLDGDAYKSIKISFPQVEEQRRLASILDKAIYQIDAAIDKSEKNLVNARELYESSLQLVFAERGEKWERVTLETLLERGWITGHLDGNHGSDYPRKEEFVSAGVPYISASCLVNDYVDMARAKYLSPSRADLLRKGIARDGDVLFAHNATVGPVAILHTDREKVVLSTSLTYYRCDASYIRPGFLSHYMRSSEFTRQYTEIMRQSTRNQVPITKQREFYHLVPPNGEQDVIVERLDTVFESSKRLGEIYREKLSNLVELKQAILEKAFSGKLTVRSAEVVQEATE